MKKLMMMVTFSIALSHVYAQKIKESEVPAAVKAGFAKAYPDVKEVKWEKENSDYEAGFDQNKKEISALIDATGMLKEVETEISKAELPKTVQSILLIDYEGDKLEEAAKIIANGVTTYEAEVEKGEESFDLIFDAGGKVLKKELKERGMKRRKVNNKII